MAIVRNIEVIAQSPKGFDDACQQAVNEAAQTLRGISSFYIKNAECVVENNKPISPRWMSYGRHPAVILLRSEPLDDRFAARCRRERPVKGW